MIRLSLSLFVLSALALPALAQKAKEQKSERPTPPTRPFDAPGAPKFTRLDGKPGVNPPVDAEGDFVIGPDYVAVNANYRS